MTTPSTVSTSTPSPQKLVLPWLIAVHGGAGDHASNQEYEKTVKHALRSCVQATSANALLLNINAGKGLAPEQ